MIRAEFKDCSLRVTGHAHYNPGNDIVCAAVSAIAQTLLGYLLNLDGLALEYKVATGDFFCNAQEDAACGAFEMAKIGLLQVEKQYPGYLEVVAH